MDRPMRPFDGKLLTGWYGYREFSDGPLSNLGCHFIDLFNYIVGTTLPDELRGAGRHIHLEGRERIHLSRPRRGDLDLPGRVSWSATRPTSATATAM